MARLARSIARGPAVSRAADHADGGRAVRVDGAAYDGVVDFQRGQ